MRNWKTTTLGITGTIGIIAHVIESIINGKPVDWTTTIPALSVSIGLIFAKDFNVSGTGTEPK